MAVKQINLTVDGKTYDDWGARTIGLDEGEDIERVFGGTFTELTAALQRGSVRALRVVAWSLLKRDNPDLRYEDVKLPISAISADVIMEDEESGPVPTGPSTGGEAIAPSPSDGEATSPTSPTGSESDPGSGST